MEACVAIVLIVPAARAQNPQCQGQPDGVACNDGNLCTSFDQCTAGVCAGTPKDCSNGLFCDGEEGCSPATGSCEAGTPLDLDDGIPCTIDSCDEANDVVLHTPNDGFCDDGDPTTVDICDPAVGCVNQPPVTVPTASDRGLIVLALLVLTTGAIILRRRLSASHPIRR